MNGFFEFEEFDNLINLKSGKTLDCETCGLYKTCDSPFMKYTGRGNKKIFIIGEAPGFEEDKQNKQFVGRSGRFLRKYMSQVGIDFEEDCWISNAVRCRPPKNKTPSLIQIKSCRPKILNEIKLLKPNVIVLVGKSAFDSIISYKLGRRALANYSSWVGEVIPDRDLNAWVLPIYHPSYIMRNEKDSVLLNNWINDLNKILKYVNKLIPKLPDVEINLIKTENELKEQLNYLSKQRWFVFDIETTGLKPHNKDSKILSFSYSFDKNSAYAFNWNLLNPTNRQLLINILQNKKIKKMAHNLKFEHQWIKNKLGIEVNGWIWDTQIAQHILENKKQTGLKYLAYAKLGIYGWDVYVENYIEADETKFNKLQLVNNDLLLQYNAYDSWITLLLYFYQRNKLSNFEINGFKLFLNGNVVFAEIQENGLNVDVERMDRVKNEIKNKIDRIKQKIENSKEVKKWDGNSKFNFNSGTQLAHLLFDILKIKSDVYTDKGSLATNVEALEKIDIPLTRLILRYRKWYKVLNTYIAQFERETNNGIINPTFNLSGVASYRSSSQAPNFQNIPKRDEEIKKLIRGFLIPSKGHKIVEYDYKSMEVMVMACYSRDKNLIKYLLDENSDMHRDIAKQIFIKNDITKYERYLAKNGFVFPAFYGSYYKQIAPNIWERLEPETKDWLKQKNIKNINTFINHIEKVEYDFWNNRFKDILEWKKKQWKFYLKYGYIELKTGFRCKGYMKQKEVINYPIQGTAFHCLLYTLINLHNKIKEKKLKSKIIGQIHDAIVVDVLPEEEQEIDYLIWYYGTQKIREDWDWLIIPLKIEKEASEVNGNWAEMKDCGYLNF